MVQESKRIVVIGHMNPDDDSISSMLATKWLVSERFSEKEIRMVCYSEKTDEWNYFKGFEEIEFVDEENNEVNRTDLLIMLDGSTFDKFSKNPKKLRKMTKKSICIDHHKNRSDVFDLVFVSASFSATAEGIYRLLVEDGQKVSRRLAEIFLLGIMGDTGNFAYLNKKTVGVLEIVQKLISENNLSIQKLQGMYQQYPKRILNLIGEMISGTRYIEQNGNWPALQISLLGKKFVDKGKYSDEEISRASHIYMTDQLLSILGFNWGVVITPRAAGFCRLSFRSLPNVVNVRKVAENFKGGGHDLASGGTVEVSDPEKALSIVLKWLRDN